ncbi:MAG: type IX secretion system membrane protein PorP/SprF [Bacteroidales bacterium]
MKTTIKIIITISLLLQIGISAKGQQDPMSTQYMFNPMWVNPSYIANVEEISFTGISRHQWVGFEGAPSTRFLSGTYPIEKLNFVLGGTLVHDVAGPENQTMLYLDYGYSVQLSKESLLNLGVRGGLGYYRANTTQLATVNDNDPSLTGDIQSRALMNIGFGASYITQQFYVGYSIPKLIRNKFDNEDISARYIRHHYLFGGAKFDINNDFVLYPSVMSKMVKGSPPSVDISATAFYRDKIGAGLMYRFGASIGAMVSYEITDKIRIGYSYDMAITRMHYNNIGTHEVMISFSMAGKGDILSRQFFPSADKSSENSRLDNPFRRLKRK